MLKTLLTYSSLIFILPNCSYEKEKTGPDGRNNDNSMVYARHLILSSDHNDYNVTVVNPWQSAKDVAFKYKLITTLSRNHSEITVPLKRVICLSTSHIGFVSVLGKQHTVVGVSGLRFMNDSLILKLADEGKIKDVGYEENLNYELILSLKPDLVFAYGVETKNIGYISKLQELGIKVIFIAEYLEDTPLAKAEWIKLFGAFYNDYQAADSIFCDIEREYNKVRQTASGYIRRPKVFAGLPWKDTWFVSGGRSYLSGFIRDAGAEYVWDTDTSKESFPLSLEKVLYYASEADFWINTGHANSLNDILKTDERLSLFKPFYRKNVYNNNKRINEYGGNDYWESGVVKPHIILKDLTCIFHPENGGTDTYFYRKLN